MKTTVSPDTQFYVNRSGLPAGMRQLKSQVGRPTIQFTPPRQQTESIIRPKLSMDETYQKPR